jgi:hypothetical protein
MAIAATVNGICAVLESTYFAERMQAVEFATASRSLSNAGNLNSIY